MIPERSDEPIHRLPRAAHITDDDQACWLGWSGSNTWTVRQGQRHGGSLPVHFKLRHDPGGTTRDAPRGASAGSRRRLAAAPSRARPDDARETLQRIQPLAAIGPIGRLLDGDVIARLPSGALIEERARDVDHLRRVGALVEERRAAARAETAHRPRGLVPEPGDAGRALGDAEPASPSSRHRWHRRRHARGGSRPSDRATPSAPERRSRIAPCRRRIGPARPLSMDPVSSRPLACSFLRLDSCRSCAQIESSIPRVAALAGGSTRLYLPPCVGYFRRRPNQAARRLASECHSWRSRKASRRDLQRRRPLTDR
jgi:hypothetical protein